MTGYQCARMIEEIIAAVQNPNCPSLYPNPQRNLTDEEKEAIAGRVAELLFKTAVPA